MRNWAIFVTGIILPLAGCATQVDLTVRNISKTPMAVRVELTRAGGVREGAVELGEVEANASAQRTFKVASGGSFDVVATVFTQRVVYRSPAFSVTGDRMVKTVEVKPSNAQQLDDDASLRSVANSFKNLGPDIGADPLELKNALETRVGAVIVAVPGDANTPGKRLYVVSPAILGVRVMTLDDVRFPSTEESRQTFISGKVATELKGSCGPIAHFGFAWKQDSFYEMHWELRGYGMVDKLEDPQKNPAVLFSRLSDEDMQYITAAIKEYPRAKIYYINEVYVLERAELTIKEGEDDTAGTDVDVADLITANGVYTFKRSKEQKSSYGPVALNYSGIEYALLTIPNAAVAPDATKGGEMRGLPNAMSLPSKEGGDAHLWVSTGRSRLFRPGEL
jgi:hypothetical protein